MRARQRLSVNLFRGRARGHLTMLSAMRTRWSRRQREGIAGPRRGIPRVSGRFPELFFGGSAEIQRSSHRIFWITRCCRNRLDVFGVMAYWSRPRANLAVRVALGGRRSLIGDSGRDCAPYLLVWDWDCRLWLSSALWNRCLWRDSLILDDIRAVNATPGWSGGCWAC